MRAMTRMLDRRHRAPIERVAKALLAKKTPSADRFDKQERPRHPDQDGKAACRRRRDRTPLARMLPSVIGGPA
jgi:hypothetical protein